jgi:hypothetical protein
MAKFEKTKFDENKPQTANFALFESLVGVGQENVHESGSKSTAQDCISPDDIKSVVRTGGLPGGSVLVHLTSCSICFREYRFALQVSKQIALAEPISPTSFWD